MTPYHYTESGLDNIYLLNGVHTIAEDGDTFTSINDLEQLHLQIAKTLVDKHSALAAKEFKFLRVELNMKKSHRNLSKYWRSLTRSAAFLTLISDALSILPCISGIRDCS